MTESEPTCPKKAESKKKILTGAAFASAGRLYRIACNAAKGTEEDESQGIAAVLLSAVAIEAWLNELGEMGRSYKFASLRSYGDIWHPLEQGNAPPLSKIQALAFVVLGKTLDQGAQPIQDLHLLFRLRNFIAHTKLDQFDMVSGDGGSSRTKFPKTVTSLAERVRIDLTDHRGTALSVLEDSRVAEWAVSVPRALGAAFAGIQNQPLNMFLGAFRQ